MLLFSVEVSRFGCPEASVSRVPSAETTYQPKQVAAFLSALYGAVAMRFQWGQVRPGEIGVVDRAEDGHAYVDFPSQSRWHGLVQELEVEPLADKVRIGARVRSALEGGVVFRSHAQCSSCLGGV